MTIESVRVIVGGREYRNWKEVRVSYGAKMAARAASLTTADPPDGWGLYPGVPAEIHAGGDLVIKGFVETLNGDVGADRHDVQVTIVTEGKNAIESSADHPTGEVRNKNLVEIAKEIDPTGTDWTGDGGENVAVFRVRPGETVFEAVERTARGQGALLIGKADGGVEVTTKPRGRHSEPIEEGHPACGFVRASASLTVAGRHSKIKVRGQSSETFTDKGQTGEAVASVPLPFDRTLIVMHEGDANDARLKKRAEWHARREAGASIKATVTVPRWRNGGQIWQPAFLVFLHVPRLRVSQVMMISTVELTQGAGGTLANLSLVDPRSLGGKGEKGDSGSEWSVPDPEVDGAR